MSENSGRTGFISIRLSVTLLVSELPKLVLCVFFDSFLQKICCIFPSEKFFDLQNGFLSLGLFTMLLCNTLAIGGPSLARIYFILLGSRFIYFTLFLFSFIIYLSLIVQTVFHPKLKK